MLIWQLVLLLVWGALVAVGVVKNNQYEKEKEKMSAFEKDRANTFTKNGLLNFIMIISMIALIVFLIVGAIWLIVIIVKLPFWTVKLF